MSGAAFNGSEKAIVTRLFDLVVGRLAHGEALAFEIERPSIDHEGRVLVHITNATHGVQHVFGMSHLKQAFAAVINEQIAKLFEELRAAR